MQLYEYVQVLVSAISRRPCYVLATATMEAKAGGTKPRVRSAELIPTPTLALTLTLTVTRCAGQTHPRPSSALS